MGTGTTEPIQVLLPLTTPAGQPAINILAFQAGKSSVITAPAATETGSAIISAHVLYGPPTN